MISYRQSNSTDDYFDGTISLASGTVSADVVAEKGDFISIYSWSSHEAGNGNTIVALKELKNRFKAPISVHDIGKKETSSYAYWKKMKFLGLVDNLLDENDRTVKAMISYRKADIIDRLNKGKKWNGEVYLRMLVQHHDEMWIVQPSTWDCPPIVKDRIMQALAESGAKDLGSFGYGFDIVDDDQQSFSVYDAYDQLKDSMMDHDLNIYKHVLGEREMTIKYESPL